MVRVADYDRYLSVLFAAQQKRAALFALYAVNYEVAKTAETVSEPTLGLMRLQWWREALEGIFEGTPRRHEVVLALSNAIETFDLPRLLFDGLIDAREQDLSPTPFAVMADFERYADAASGHLMRLAARILGEGNRLDGYVRSLGLAYALTGLLRAMPYHASKRRIMLPMSALSTANLSEEDIYSGRADNIRILNKNMIAKIEEYLSVTPKEKIPRRVVPAILAAALIRPYLNVMKRGSFDPYRNPVDISLPRKQAVMLGAMLRGRI